MNFEQRQKVLEQFPSGTVITKIYNAFENGETRVIVKLPSDNYETRYVAHFEGENVRLVHRP